MATSSVSVFEVVCTAWLPREVWNLCRLRLRAASALASGWPSPSVESVSVASSELERPWWWRAPRAPPRDPLHTESSDRDRLMRRPTRPDLAASMSVPQRRLCEPPSAPAAPRDLPRFSLVAEREQEHGVSVQVASARQARQARLTQLYAGWPMPDLTGARRSRKSSGVIWRTVTRTSVVRTATHNQAIKLKCSLSILFPEHT